MTIMYSSAMSAAETPLVTIACVVRNGGHVLAAALDSVTRQRERCRLELIVVDGQSTDDTLEIIGQREDEIDRWISEADTGIYNAMNKARRLARGDWLMFLGADDRLTCDIAAIARLLRDRSSVYYGDVRMSSSGRLYDGEFSRYKLMQRNICHQAIFYPRDAYKHKAYDEHSGLLADHRYNIELHGMGIPFVYLGQEIALFNDSGASSGGDPSFEARKLKLIRENFGFGYFAMKWMRNGLVRIAKGTRGP